MGCRCSFASVVIGLSIIAGLIGVALYFVIPTSDEPPRLVDSWWGTGQQREEDTGIKEIKIAFPEQELVDLKKRLTNTRFFENLEEVGWEYGGNQKYMREFVDYWITKFDWRAQEDILNTYKNYATNIEGLRVHFWHIKPQLKEGQTLIPIMFIHGWPGSFFEFYKLIPLLVKESQTGNFAYEIVCPSIPGYGLSEAAPKPGFSSLSAAGIFIKLMARLGHSSYYVQGGDWGAVISKYMALMDKRHVKGLHLNMFHVPAPYGPLSYVTAYFMLPPKEHKKIFPVKDLFLKGLQELGYFHLQATRPDSLGLGLTDSPAGLATYIVEKFFVWTGCHLNESLACLESHFTKDELITNVMIYWLTNSITSSMRLYKETMASGFVWNTTRAVVDVPTGLADFPHELFNNSPEPWLSSVYVNLVQYTEMPRGGHFAAFEEPELLAKDVIGFVQQVEAKID